jgi:hypothetical protein
MALSLGQDRKFEFQGAETLVSPDGNTVPWPCPCCGPVPFVDQSGRRASAPSAPPHSIVEFKQIIGRGIRNFADAAFDGDHVEMVAELLHALDADAKQFHVANLTDSTAEKVWPFCAGPDEVFNAPALTGRHRASLRLELSPETFPNSRWSSSQMTPTTTSAHFNKYELWIAIAIIYSIEATPYSTT